MGTWAMPGLVEHKSTSAIMIEERRFILTGFGGLDDWMDWTYSAINS